MDEYRGQYQAYIQQAQQAWPQQPVQHEPPHPQQETQHNVPHVAPPAEAAPATAKEQGLLSRFGIGGAGLEEHLPTILMAAGGVGVFLWLRKGDGISGLLGK